MADVDGFDALPGAGDIRAGLASVAPVGGTPCRGRQPTAGGVLSFGDVAADVVPGQVSEVTVVGINPVHGKRTPLGKISVSLIGCGWNDRFLVCPAATSRCGASPGTEAGLLGAPANTPFAGAPDRHAVTVIWIGPVLFDRSGSTASPVTVNAPSAPTDGSVMRRISVPKNAGPPAEAGSAGVQRYSLGDTGAQMSGALTNWVPVGRVNPKVYGVSDGPRFAMPKFTATVSPTRPLAGTALMSRSATRSLVASEDSSKLRLPAPLGGEPGAGDPVTISATRPMLAKDGALGSTVIWACGPVTEPPAARSPSGQVSVRPSMLDTQPAGGSKNAASGGAVSSAVTAVAATPRLVTDHRTGPLVPGVSWSIGPTDATRPTPVSAIATATVWVLFPGSGSGEAERTVAVTVPAGPACALCVRRSGKTSCRPVTNGNV